MAGNFPIFGVCLGHQSIGYAFGSKIIKAKKLLHGKTSDIYHNGKGIYKDLSNPFKATRYHSLVIDKKLYLMNLILLVRLKMGQLWA